MQILKTLTRRIALLIAVFAAAASVNAYAGQNPGREEIESMIEEVAVKRAIPAVLLKAIARVETSCSHYNSNGTVKTNGNCIGLMMVNNSNGGYDSNKLKNDIQYNIEAGADVLLSKWSMSSLQSVASVGNMDPNVLENWYFALWAYNGWAQSNNPHMLQSYVKKYTYQQLIYDICKEEYQQNINNIDFSYLPNSGKPSRSLIVPTPSNVNYGGLVLYEKGDYVRTDTIRKAVYLRDEPSGKYIYELSDNTLCRITDGPVLKDGYYWYKVEVNDQVKGWTERNWLTRTGDVENGLYTYDDIAFHWSRKSVMKLKNSGKIDASESFRPEEDTTRESFCVFLSKTLNLNTSAVESSGVDMEGYQNNDTGVAAAGLDIANIPLPAKDGAAQKPEAKSMDFADAGNISSWATEHVQNVFNAGMLDNYTGSFRPKASLTRKEAAVILSSVCDDVKNVAANINTIFTDIGSLSQSEQEAIQKVYYAGLMSGKSKSVFNPEGSLSRGESAVIMDKLMSMNK